MELVNRTAVTARVDVSEIEGVPYRMGFVTAKATFVYGAGRAELDTQAPLAVWGSEQETALGVLPRDLVIRRDDRFEVMLLGTAQAPGRRPVREMRVRLSVGAVRRELAVFGDRMWDENGVMSAAAELVEMPLTWQRAFGGACEVEIDEGATMELADPFNRLGRGFDVETQAREIGKALRSREGFFRFDAKRWLPISRTRRTWCRARRTRRGRRAGHRCRCRWACGARGSWIA